MVRNQSSPVRSADNLFAVLDAVHELEGAGVTEIAEYLDLPKSTIHDHLTTLVKHKFLTKDRSTYRVGLRCYYYGIQAKKRREFLDVVKPSLDRIARKTGEISWFMVEEHGKGVYLEKSKGDQAVQPYGELGKRVPMHNIASGKAILAHMPEERVREIVRENPIENSTENTLSNVEELLDALETIRERGYALNDGETFEGFRAVASPIIHDGEPLGSIAVSGPENRFRGERFTKELPEMITGAANAIELSLTSH